MKVRILSPGPGMEHQYLSTYVIDDRVAVDAGCLGLAGPPEEQARIRHVLLSHIHLDHVLSLPIFLQNASDGTGDPVTAYGHRQLLDQLRTDVFNGRLWGDFPLRRESGGPCLELVALEPETTVSVGGLRITPVFVDHSVPAFGFIVDDGECVVVFGADSGPTERIWEIARGMKRWKGALLETTFPDSLGDLAARTGHLTPALLRREAEKVPPDVTVVTVHLSPRHRARIVAELAALSDPRIVVGVPGREYVF